MIKKTMLFNIVVLALIFSACVPATETTPSTSLTLPFPTETMAATSTVMPLPSLTPLPPPFPQNQTVNRLDVELLNARILDGQLTINICHQMPTQEDWIVGNHPEDVFVTTGGKKINISGFGFLYYRTSSDTGKNTHRCDALNFPMSDPNPGKMTLTINEFYTSVPEVPDCAAAQKKLDEAGAGIKFTCNSGPGYSSFDITQKPAGMSNNDARMIVFDSFSSHVKGPWVFEINMPTQLVETTSTP